MTAVAIEDAALRGFVAEFFKGANGRTWGVAAGTAPEFEVADRLVAWMLRRSTQDVPFALPHTSGDIDHWIVLGGDQADLDRATQRIERALVPSFALFSVDGDAAVRSEFDRDGNALHALGARRFPAGYYRFVSPSAGEDRARVCERLLRWARLEEERPPARDEEVPTYAALTARFHAATAAGQWDDGAEAIADLEGFNLCSADNIRFLEFEFLARQGRWGELWAARDRDQIVKLRIPRAVRAALLTAFHVSVLAPLEAGDLPAALARYHEVRPQLGVLLAGRFGLEQPAVLAVFGYEAVVGGAAAELDALIAAAADPVASVLRGLAALLPAGEAASTVSDAEARVRAAMLLGELEEALVGADDIADSLRRLVARIEIAAQAGDGPLAVDVLREVGDLSPVGRATLQATSAALDTQLALLAKTVAQPVDGTGSTGVAPPGETWAVADWNAWFAAALADPASSEAYRAIERVSGTLEGSFDDAWALDLADRVVAAAIVEELSARPAYREAVDRLAREIVADSAFPREGEGAARLYEALFDSLIDGKSGNDTQTMALLALTDAMLTRQPARVMAVATAVLAWFDRPFPALEQRALEAVELLVDYGAEAHQLMGAIRAWITDMLDRPTRWDDIRIAVWQRLVAWAHAGPDLERGLADRLATAAATAENDPVAALPDGYRIAMFTLRPLSAERAKAVLLARNPRLRVDICEDKVLTMQAQTLARAADLPLIVTQCAKHALTEGIRDILRRDPVYPSGVGSTGIVRAVVEAAIVGAGAA